MKRDRSLPGDTALALSLWSGSKERVFDFPAPRPVPNYPQQGAKFLT